MYGLIKRPMAWGPDFEKEFEILEKVGYGSYASVWKAKHIATGKIVAIKREENIWSDPTNTKNIMREIKILRNLKHEGIVKLLDVRGLPEKEYDTLLLFLECHGSDLKKVIRTQKTMSAEQIKKIIYEMLKAIKYFHSAGVLHRDMKPGNILLNAEKKPVICDFGLARAGLDYDETKELNCQEKEIEKPKIWDLDNAEDPLVEEAKLEKLMIKQPRKMSFQKLSPDLTSYVASRWYRAPEIILTRATYGTGLDIWAAGCIFAELLSMLDPTINPESREALFPGASCYPYSPHIAEKLRCGLSLLDKDQLNVIISILGTPTLDDCSFIDNSAIIKVLQEKKITKIDFTKKYAQAELDAIDLLTKMLLFNPIKRATVEECLGHKYFADIRKKEEEISEKVPIMFDFDKVKDFDMKKLKELINTELDYFNELRNKGLIKW